MQVTSAIELSIIVVSYNTRALTLACLDSLTNEIKRLPEGAVEVIVADNGSNDGSVAAIRQHSLGVKVIALDRNVGFGAANNLAVAKARGAYILLLNPDTIVLEKAVFSLLCFAKLNPEALIWGGRTLFADGRLNPASCWRQMTPWNLFCRLSGLANVFKDYEFFNGEAYGGWRRDYIREVDIVSGCFLMTTRALWDRLQGFDPMFFMYGEEADFCLRAKALGARPMIMPRATIIHLGGAAERTRVAKMVKLLSAKATLIRRHWSSNWVPVGLALLAAWPVTRWVSLSVLGRLMGRDDLRAAARTWREIWLQRSQWRTGYGALGASARQELVATK